MIIIIQEPRTFRCTSWILKRQRNQTSNICWIIEKATECQKKKSTSASLSMLKLLTVWIKTTCGKFFKRWNYQTTLPVSWEICMQEKKQQLEQDMGQWTGSKLGKEHVKAVYCHPAYLTYIQRTSCKMAGWIKHKLEWRLPGEIWTTSDMQMMSLQWQKVKRN